jgi:cytochrome c oxidase assembly protein subunit 15
VAKKFSRYAWGVLGFNLLVIAWGALVRASGSGEGCGDHWPLCNGTMIPHAAQIATLIEFTHRATTGIALFSVIGLFLWARRAFPRGPVRAAAAASLILILTEALLGAGLVLFRYTGENVSVGRVVYLSAHLINTLLMLGAMTLAAWWGSGRRVIRVSPAARGAIAAALLIGVTGAVAALSDTLFPAKSLASGWAMDFSSAAPWLVRLRIWHPVIAALAGLYIAIVALRARRPAGNWVALLVVAQIAAGLINLELLAPVWMQLIHLLLADFLWIAIVIFAASVERPAEAGHPLTAHQPA